MESKSQSPTGVAKILTQNPEPLTLNPTVRHVVDTYLGVHDTSFNIFLVQSLGFWLRACFLKSE